MPILVRPGDCLDVMRGMADNSVHAVVTDPPYNLAFMSREWDTHATPRHFQDWCTEWAAECLRVLRPGGYLLAFGGTRTFHRLACAVEDAGFEIRDSIAWLYGCLDDQTEILVDGRWEPYRNVKQSQHALGYDVERDEFSWQPIQRVVVFPHSDTAYRLVGDHTDQLVTREHRCLVERGGAYEFCEAQEVARQRQARVPVLEDVQRLLDALPLPHSRTGGAEPDLLTDVRGASRQSSEDGAPGCQCQPVADMPGVHQAVPAVTYEASRGPVTGVLDTLPREAGRGPVACRCTEGSRRLDGSVTGVLHGEDVRPRQPCMEGWGDVLAVERQLQGREVRAVSTGVRGDEPRGRVRHGAPAAGCACGGSTAAAHRGRASRGPRPAEQHAREPGAVRVEPRPQAVRGARFTTADLVRVEPEHYDGIAWCVTVPTGAFVARRNGKVFVTGNSGFPKSLDVGKAIDKAGGNPLAFRRFARAYAAAVDASLMTHTDIDRHLGVKSSSCYWAREDHRGGMPPRHHWDAVRDLLGLSVDFERLYDEAEREVLGERRRPATGREGYGFGEDFTDTAPATPAAREWAGWGTALKPAHEPIVCARKPFNLIPFDWRLVANVHHALAGLLWLSLSPAKRAELTSPSRSHALAEGTCASALVTAALGTSPDESVRTGTFSSPELASTSSSIVGSWNAILAALSDSTTTSTTSTASSTTTALRTLNSLLAPLTSPTTMPACGCLLGGSASSAESAGEGSTGSWPRWLHTLTATAPESATTAIALAVRSALASVAADLSSGEAVGSTAAPTATTRADARDSAFEPVVVARKPLVGSVAGNVQEWGCGALNIDACRVATTDDLNGGTYSGTATAVTSEGWRMANAQREFVQPVGRWPPNVALDESQADALDQQSGTLTSSLRQPHHDIGRTQGACYGTPSGAQYASTYGDSGGASRFFPTFRYQAKAPTSERPTYTTADGRKVAHPTVKPLGLMRWLVRLVTPPGGVVLDPFAGSGPTVEACLIEGFDCIAIERDPESLPLIQIRIDRQAGTLPFEDVS